MFNKFNTCPQNKTGLHLHSFRHALRELEAEGGVSSRERRNKAKKKTLDAGMASLGFKQYVHPDIQGHINTSFIVSGESAF